MNWLAEQFTRPDAIGFTFRAVVIVVGLLAISVYWLCNLIHQLFCKHPNLESYDEDDFVYCIKCGKEVKR